MAEHSSGAAEHAFRAGKLDIGELGAGEKAAPREEPRTIPWSYGDDRVTAMAVDPGRLFVYWEVTDAAMARARRDLGAGGPDAWLNLRVYDTSGRLFDGTNAHGYTDRGVGRADRQFFFDIGKPGSDAFVEIGLLSREGYFIKIARSGRVWFPRREPVGWGDPEWMTVSVHSGDVVRVDTRDAAAAADRVQGGGPAGSSHGDAAAGDGARFESAEPAPWRMHLSWEELIRSGLGVELQLGEQTSSSWEEPATITSWEAGPFACPVEVAPPVTDFIAGPARSFTIGGRTHVVYGPWQVVVRGLAAHRSGQILQRWEIHRAWVSSDGRAVRAVVLSPRAGERGASERMFGASERRWIGASERRLGGASEVFYLGASERRLLGASETLFQAASQWLLRGASERLGGSEARLGGASEGRYPAPPSRRP